jgi:hypothetical protein
MWGNTLGWKISAVLFAVAIAVGLWLRSQMQITGPTALSLDPKNLAELTPPVAAQTIVAQDQPGDAGDQYLDAARLYQDDSDACDEYARTASGPLPPPMQAVVGAAHFSQMNLFSKDPSSQIDYQSDHPQLDNLAKVGQDMEAAALLLRRAGKFQESRQLLDAAYAMGLNLLRERVNHDEYFQGMGVMDGALTGLSELESDSSQKQSLLAQADGMVNYDQQSVQPIFETLQSIDPVKIARNAGDVFRFAALSHERMFRVEAILKLGRYRFDAARPADQLAAPRFLRSFSKDPDPVIRAAAGAALGLTLEQYRMIH